MEAEELQMVGVCVVLLLKQGRVEGDGCSGVGEGCASRGDLLLHLPVQLVGDTQLERAVNRRCIFHLLQGLVHHCQQLEGVGSGDCPVGSGVGDRLELLGDVAGTHRLQ